MWWEGEGAGGGLHSPDSLFGIFLETLNVVNLHTNVKLKKEWHAASLRKLCACRAVAVLTDKLFVPA